MIPLRIENDPRFFRREKKDTKKVYLVVGFDT